VLNEIKNSGKEDYLNKDHPNFSRIMHDYSAGVHALSIKKPLKNQRLKFRRVCRQIVELITPRIAIAGMYWWFAAFVKFQ
jgi:hypothetical protein